MNIAANLAILGKQKVGARIRCESNAALLYCCTLRPVWLRAAERNGKETLKARLVPMEIHERHICKRKAGYVGYWSSNVDDMIEDAKRARELGRKQSKDHPSIVADLLTLAILLKP